MKSSRLALRITLNSIIMILTVYVAMQTIVFLRDNLILGISDLSALPSSVGAFIGGSVLPPMALFAVLIYLMGLRIQKVQDRLIAGETLPPEAIERTRKRILGFSTLILVVNLIGFAMGYAISQVLSGKADELVAPSGMLILVSNLAGSVCYAYAQSALNNLSFAGLRERLGITRIGDRKRELANGSRQIILTVCLAVYVLTLVQMNVYDLARVKEIETDTLHAVRRGEVAPADAASDYRARLADRFFTFSTRKGMDFSKVPLPWERGQGLPGLELGVFLLFGVFVFLIAAAIQVAWSEDLRRQLQALMRRLRDVVAGGGDLTKRIHVLNIDDIGEITDLVNQLLDQFRNVVSRIGAAADGTRDTASSIETVLNVSSRVAKESAEAFQALKADLERQSAESGELVEALDAFGSAVQGVVAAVETQRRYVTETSAAMEEMASSIESVEAMTMKAKNITGALSEQGLSGGKAVSETSLAIANIEESAKKVMTVLGVLNKIASSTNMLSMNAAIEASHAGESGKGFAVVAEEVRSLANNAVSQTKEIRELIKTMSERVGTGVKTAQASGKVLGDLVRGLGDATVISGEISTAMQEQAQGTRQVADSLLRIVSASDAIQRRMDDQAARTGRMSETLSQSIGRLDGLVGDAREQTGRTTALEESFAAVREEVRKNQEAVNQLHAEIERFQV